MSTRDQSNWQDAQLSSVLRIIGELAAKSAEGGYIYRGERKHYKKVCSSLYREYAGVEVEDFDIEILQNEMLNAAKKHTGELPQGFSAELKSTPGHRVRISQELPQRFSAELEGILNVVGKDNYETDDFEILTEIQHYGGKTNLIDFTTDYLIALFFACDGHPNENGRVIIQDKTGIIKEWIRYPQNPRHRVIAQKSVFVRPPNGFIELHEDDVIDIPTSLKQPILEHLRKAHNISTETIYNDLQGFIINQGIHGSAYSAFYRGFACQSRADETKIPEEKQKEYERSIEYYNEALTLKPDLFEGYNNRGNTYESLGRVDKAIEDYDEAIRLNPKFREAYYNRGTAYIFKAEFDRAVEDYDEAIRLHPEFREAHYNRGTAHFIASEFDLAIKDYTKVIELDPDDAKAYYDRAIVWLCMENWPKAKVDLTAARNRGADIVALFANACEDVNNFEQKVGVKLPEDIVEMLSLQ